MHLQHCSHANGAETGLPYRLPACLTNSEVVVRGTEQEGWLKEWQVISFINRSLRNPNLVLWALVAGLYASSSNGQTPTPDHGAALELTLKTDKGIYKLENRITVTATLRNVSQGITYLYALDFGESASFSFWIKDALSEATIQSEAIADALPPPPVSRSSLLGLAPSQIKETSFTATLAELGINRSGKYQLRVIYHCPLTKKFAFGLPIWQRREPRHRVKP